MIKSKVLLSGGGGFIGSHVLDQLAKVDEIYFGFSLDQLRQAGSYDIVAILRSNEAIQALQKLHPEYSNLPVTFVVVPDLATEGACDEILKNDDFEFIVHTAGKFKFENLDIEELITANYNTAKALVDSAKRLKRLKRFVLTGSIIVELIGQMDPSTFKESISEADIGKFPLDAARSTGQLVPAYIASKLAASAHLMSAARDPSVSWDAVELLPAGTIGPLIHAVGDLEAASHSLDWARCLISGAWKEIPNVPMYQITDVRDVATAHILAMHSVVASNLTINIVNSESRYSHQRLADIIRELLPETREKVPVGEPGRLVQEGSKFFQLENRKSKEIFGKDLVYRPESESFKDYIESTAKLMELASS